VGSKRLAKHLLLCDFSPLLVTGYPVISHKRALSLPYHADFSQDTEVTKIL
jgi:hypothetical protein